MLTSTVLRLRCEGCGGTLHGTPEAVLFWCGDCRAVSEVVEGRFTPRRMLTARPAIQASGKLWHLPLWAFRVRASVAASDSATVATPEWRVPEWVYVTAFALSNGFYFGDPGLILTQRQVALVPGDPAPVIGGTRSLEEAKVFVEPHLLSLFDRRADSTGLELSCAIDEAVLWALPYYDDGLTLVDGILGMKLPGAALDEIGALRVWWGQRQ